MSTTELELADRNTVAAFKLAANAATMRCAVRSSTTSHFHASLVGALLPTTVFNAKFGRRLRTFVAALNRTSTTAAMRRAQARSTNCRFGATLILATLPTPVRSAEELVASALVASRKGAATSTPMGNAKTGRALRTFRAAFVFAETVATVSDTVWSTRDNWIVATLNSANRRTHKNVTGRLGVDGSTILIRKVRRWHGRRTGGSNAHRVV